MTASSTKGLRGAAKRILIIRQGYYPEDPRVRREAEALVAAGFRVQVLCLRKAGQMKREICANVEAIRLPMGSAGRKRSGALRYLLDYALFFVMASAACSLLNLRHSYALVQVNTMPDALVWAAWLPKIQGRPVVLDLHELMPELFASKFRAGLQHPLPRMLAFLETRAISWADAAIAVSRPCLDAYVARGAPAEAFTIVMNSADPALFAQLPNPDAEASELESLGPKDPNRPAIDSTGRDPNPRPRPLRLVSHGTLVERYGYDLILDALSLLDDLKDLRLEIYGEGEQRKALAEKIESLGLEDRVKLMGFVPLADIPDRIRGASAGIVANRSDPFTDLVVPTKLMEYIALGIPGIAAQTPAVLRYFEEDMILGFPPGDVEALAFAIRKLHDESDLGSRLSAAAQERFLSRWGWPKMSQRYVGLIERLTG